MIGKNHHWFHVLLYIRHKPVMHKQLVKNLHFLLKYILSLKYYIVTFYFWFLIDVCCLGYY